MDLTITPGEVEALYRPLSDPEKKIVRGLASYAESLLALDVPELEARMAGNRALCTYVRGEIAFAIKRVLANPDFLRQVSTTVDDATVSRTVDQAVSAGLLYFPEAALARMRGERRAAGAFSIRPSW